MGLKARADGRRDGAAVSPDDVFLDATGRSRDLRPDRQHRAGGLLFFLLLFLTPNFVPRDKLTEPMEIAATFNPGAYLMEALRSLILADLDWSKILPGFAVLAGLGLIVLLLNIA